MYQCSVPETLRLLLASAFGMVCSGTALAQIVFVGPASDPGCQYQSIQAAIDDWAASSSPQFREIYIANAHAYPAQQLSIPTPTASVGLALRGQYPGCAFGAAGGRALLSGAGAAGGPVIDIHGSVAGADARFEVSLSSIEIADGSNPGGNGGGIRVRGNVHVSLFESALRDNSAAQGGGLAAEGTAAGQPTMVMFGNGTPFEVSGNTALGGGGMYCENAVLTCERYCLISNNIAANSGGGVLGLDCVISINGSRNQLPLDPMVGIRGNSAGADGGGVWVSGGFLRLGSVGAPGPTPVVGNSAVGNGGAVVYDGATVNGDAYGAQFDGNSAGGNGGAIVVRGGNLSFSPLTGGTHCPGGLDACPRFRDNTAAGRGGAIRMEAGAAGLQFMAHMIDGNQALRGSVLDRQGAIGGLTFTNTHVSGNGGASELFLLDGGFLDLRYTTIADNGTDDSALVRFDAPAHFIATNALLADDNGSASGLVLDAPAGSTTMVNCVMVHEDSRLAGQPGVHGLVVDDPQWDDSGDFDPRLFVPGATSAAVDACGSGPGSIGDLLGTPRPQDTALPDLAGPYDMGAIERPFVVRVFGNGFEGQ